MNERIKIIYTYLYENSEYCTKSKLASILDVNPKTIENTFKTFDDNEVKYDKDLERYRFDTLLPKYIPYKVFYKMFQDSIVNPLIKDDFLKIEELIDSSSDILMIETSKLSKIVQKIIMINIAINDNCLLKIEYGKPGSTKIDEKYVQPNTIFSNGFTYYCYVTYDEKNEKDIGEKRTFAFNRMGGISPVKHIANKIFKIKQKGNAFGVFNKDNYILLEFDKYASSFFQKEQLLNNSQFELIEIDEVSNIYTIKMYYNSLDIEVVKIIQQWMPHIKIHPTDEKREYIYNKIQENFSGLGYNKFTI